MEPSSLDTTKTQQPPDGKGDSTQAGTLDLSNLAPPQPLEELRLEEVTIDGICGVY